MNKYTLKKLMNVLLKTGLFLVLLATISGTCIFIYASTPSGKKTVQRILESAIAANTGARVMIGGLSGNLIGSLEIEDLRIFGIKGKTPVVSAGRIRASYDLLALLFREVSIRRLEFERLAGHLEIGKNNAIAIPGIAFPNRGAGAEQGPRPGFNVHVSKLVIAHSEISIQDKSGKLPVDYKISHVSGQAEVRVNKKVFVSVRALSFTPGHACPKVSNLSGRVVFDPGKNRVTISSAKIATPGSRIFVDGGIAFGKDAPAFTLRADVAPLSCVEVGNIFKMAGDGEVAGTLSASGEQNRFSIDARFSRRDTRVTIAGEIRHTGNAWDLSGASGRVVHLDPAALPFFPAPDFPGDITADIRVSGTDIFGNDRNMEITAVSSAPRLSGYHADRVRIAGVLAGDDLDVREMWISAPWGRVRATAEVTGLLTKDRDKAVTLMARVDGLDPGMLSGKTGLPADINGLVSSSGSIPASLVFPDSQFSGDIKIIDSEAAGISHLAGTLSAAYGDRGLRVGKIALTAPRGKVTASGSADFRTRACTANFSATVSDFLPFSKLMDAGFGSDPVSGRADVSGTLSGTIERPVISAALTGTDLGMGSTTVRELKVTGNWQAGPPAGTLDCRARLAGVSAGAMRLSTLFLESSANRDVIRVSGTAEALDTHIHAEANLKNWRTETKTLTITRLTLDAKDESPITNNGPVAVTINGDRIAVHSVTLASGSAKVNLSGNVTLAAGGDILLNADCRDFDLDRISPFFKALKGISGRAAGRITIADTLESPALDADIRVSDPMVMGIGFSEVHLSVAGKTSRYNVMFEALRAGKKAVTLSGAVFLPVCLYPFSAQTESGRMVLSLYANDFSLAGIDLPFSDDILLSGDVSTDSWITGTFKSPSAEGDIRFSNGSLLVRSLGLSYENCDAEFRFLQNRVRVVGLNIKGDKEGSLSASGSLTFAGRLPESFGISITGKNFYIPFQNAVFLRTEPDLTLTGTANAPVLTGRIKVKKGTIEILRLFSAKPAEIEVVNAPKNGGDILELPEKAKQPGFMEPLAADIAVVVDRDLWVKGKEENIEINGRVNVKKQPDHPFIVLGQANAVRGTYMFRDRLFKITDGSLNFLGAEKINPILNITGRTRIPPVDINAHLTGTFSELNLTLDSDPVMDRVDIVSYLMFGRAVNDLSSGESFRAQDAAISMTGQLAADQLKDILGKSFHLDVVQVNAGSGDLRQGGISVGKYVAPRVFVTYSQGFSQEAGRSVEIDYEINRHFSVEAQAGEETTSALDLIWRHDF